MPFTQPELDNIANASLDWYIRGPALSNIIQARPLWDWLNTNSKNFAGGKEMISEAVKGVYTTSPEGYNTDDTVSYANPANILRAEYPWKEIHGGIVVTLSELKIDGISVVDSATSAETTTHSNIELARLVGLLDDKLEDMFEGFTRGMADMLWLDGTQDAKEIPGVSSFIVDDPTGVGSPGGIDQQANTWWQNRADLTRVGDVSNGGATLQFLQKEYRQLRRYGGRANAWFAGSDMLDQLETELRANGNYSDTGFSRRAATDGGMADVYFKGNLIRYDPHLDDLSREKRLYVMDERAVYYSPMEGEKMKQHTPARPSNQYVMYRALTETAGLVCKQRNVTGVYALA